MGFFCIWLYLDDVDFEIWTHMHFFVFYDFENFIKFRDKRDNVGLCN